MDLKCAYIFPIHQAEPDSRAVHMRAARGGVLLLYYTQTYGGHDRMYTHRAMYTGVILLQAECAHCRLQIVAHAIMERHNGK